MANASFPVNNWHTLQPSNIENTLAMGALDPAKAGMAMALLGGYSLERQGLTNSYRESLGQAQDMARQQMMLTARKDAIDQLLRATKDAQETPGLMDIYASNPLTAQLFAGTNPDAYGTTVQAIARAAAAKNAQATGTGVDRLVQGGFTPSTDWVSAVLGDKGVQAGPPLALRTAAAHAASSGGTRWSVSDPMTGVGASGKAPDIATAVQLGKEAQQQMSGQRFTNALEVVRQRQPQMYNRLMAQAGGDRAKAETLAQQYVRSNTTAGTRMPAMAPTE